MNERLGLGGGGGDCKATITLVDYAQTIKLSECKRPCLGGEDGGPCAAAAKWERFETLKWLRANGGASHF